MKPMKNKIAAFSSGLNLNDWSIIFILFTSIISLNLVPLGFILWILTFYLNKNTVTIKSIFSGLGKWFLLYYIVLLLGMLWTENDSFGLSKLENKLSFLLIPILFTISHFSISRKQFMNVLLFSLLMSLLINYGLALYKYFTLTESSLYDSLINANFSQLMHRSYYCNYLIIGCIVILDRLFQKEAKWLYLMLFTLFSIGIFQTLAKSGILIYFILIPAFLFWQLLKTKQYKAILISLLGFVISIFFLAKVDNPIKTRFQLIPDAIENFESKNNPSTESNTSRLLMWSTSIDIFKEFPILGVGTGDYDDVLTSVNERYGNSGVAIHRYNSHNQFLNTTVQLGLLGLVVLITLFLYGFKMAYQQRNIIGLFTLSCFFLNFLFESFIESQAGIILFCLLTIAIFYLKPKTNRYHNGLTPIPKENFK